MDTIVNDMRLTNDFVLKGYENYTTGWYVGPGSVQMGSNPCFCNTPVWSDFHNNPKYSGITPQAILPWMVVFAGVSNAASNTAFQIRDVTFYIKSKSSGKWNVQSGPTTASGMSFGTAAAPGAMQDQINVTLADGSKAIKPPTDTLMWHGWSDAGITTINPNDIGAIFVTMQARLVVADASKADDRAKAQYGLQVGADYYLNSSTTWGNGIAPGSGVTRTKKLTNDWQSMSYTSFNDVGVQDPGAGISEAAFRAAPPPLQPGSSTTSAEATGSSTASTSTTASTSASASSSASSATVKSTSSTPVVTSTSSSASTTTKAGVIPRQIVLAVSGDSIASGAGPSNGINEYQYVSYRGPLYQALTSAGATVTMVGTNSMPVRDNLGPTAHSAQGGAMLDTSPSVTSLSQLMDNLKAAYPNGPYDNWVYVLEGGTNNIYTNNGTQIAAKWEAIIQKQQALFPSSTLVMVGMMPASWIDSSFYSAINPVLAAHDNGGKLVDALMANAGLTTTDYVADATHLSKAGSVKAGNWIAQRVIARMR